MQEISPLRLTASVEMTGFFYCERQCQQKRQGIGDGLCHLDALKTDEEWQDHDCRDEENALSTH